MYASTFGEINDIREGKQRKINFEFILKLREIIFALLNQEELVELNLKSRRDYLFELMSTLI